MIVVLLFEPSFMAVAVWTSWRHGYGTRAPFSAGKLWVAFREAAFALGAPVIVLGGILSGIVTVTEAAALILLVPVLVVLAPRMGVDPVQFGVLMVVNLAVGMLTPPVGICLFVSCGISGLPLGQVSRAVMPFLAVAMAALLISCFWPPVTLWLPSLIYR